MIFEMMVSFPHEEKKKSRDDIWCINRDFNSIGRMLSNEGFNKKMRLVIYISTLYDKVDYFYSDKVGSLHLPFELLNIDYSLFKSSQASRIKTMQFGFNKFSEISGLENYNYVFERAIEKGLKNTYLGKKVYTNDEKKYCILNFENNNKHTDITIQVKCSETDELLSRKRVAAIDNIWDEFYYYLPKWDERKKKFTYYNKEKKIKIEINENDGLEASFQKDFTSLFSQLKYLYGRLWNK
jgi:hypothetical protein